MAIRNILDIFKIKKFKEEISNLEQINADLIKKIDAVGIDDYLILQEKMKFLQKSYDEKFQSLQESYDEKFQSLQKSYEDKSQSLQKVYDEKLQLFNNLSNDVVELIEKNQKVEKQIATSQKKLGKIKKLYKCVENAVQNYTNTPFTYQNCKISPSDSAELDLLSPSITLKLHCMDMKDLRKAYRDNEKQINTLLNQYSARYTTKANKTIYDLMVIALRAELQNILYNLKYEKLDKSVEAVKEVSKKYLKLTCEGNQSIAGTITKFIGEIEYLFINAVKIEYNYYVKKEQARQEQLAIKEQMRQEAEERKALVAEKAKIEKEEEKYNNELSRIKEQLMAASDAEAQTLKQRILELQEQLSNVVVKKDKIMNLQNGKAGNVYIISNLGSFGENIFKIGMTRRQDPQDRINELGNASVPFKFDVHSLIFSSDAVDLEGKLHKKLNNKRVNKVNMRKEFFNVSIDELEKIVNDIDPTAEFNRTMIAEEYHQSLSSDNGYTTDYVPEFDEEEELDESIISENQN